MSERIAASIAIGGTLSRRLVAKLCAQITQEGMTLDWGGANFHPQSAEELLTARQQHDGTPILWLCDDQASWGQFPDLEQFLAKHRIPFDRHSSGTAEYTAELVTFRPHHGRHSRLTTANGEPIVPCQPLAAVLEVLDQAASAGQAKHWSRCLRRLQSARSALQSLLPPDALALPAFAIA